MTDPQPRPSGGLIISAFPATGKTHMAERRPSFVDSDSTRFGWRFPGLTEARVRHPEWPANYIAHILRYFKEGRVVLVSTHAEVRETLERAGIYFVLVYPERHLRAEYRERMEARGSPPALVERIIAIWDDALDQLDAQRGCDHLTLGAGRYLADVWTP